MARAGLRPPVPMVTTRSPWRTTDIRVNEQLAGSSAEFTQTRRASPASNTARFTAGSSVAAVASQAPSRSAGAKRRSATVRRPASGQARTSSPTSGATTWTCGPGGEQRLDLAGRDPAGAHDDAAAPVDEQVHRVARRDRRRVPAPDGPGSPTSDVLSGAAGRSEDLELGREVDLAQRDPFRDGHDRGREVEDRADARLDQAVGDLLAAARAWR